MLAKNSVFLCHQLRMVANVCEFVFFLEFARVRKELQTFANSFYVRKEILNMFKISLRIAENTFSQIFRKEF